VLELAQEQVDEYAWSMLVEEVARAIAKSDEPARVSAIVEEVRAGGLPVGPGLVNSALEHAAGETPQEGRQPAFVKDGPRWELGWRVEGTSLDRTMRQYLETFGQMPTPDEISRQVALAIQQGPRETRETVIRLLETRDTYFVHDRRVGLRSWLLDTTAGTEEDVVLDNFFDQAQDAEDVQQAFDAIRSDNLIDTALRAYEAVGPGLTAKMVLFAWWKTRPESFDSVAALVELLGSDELYITADHWVFPGEARELFRDALAAAAAATDDSVVEEADASALADEIEIGPEEVRLAVQAVTRRTASVAVETLAEEILEVRRDEPGFSAVAAKLDDALRAQGEIAMCGRGRWISRQNRPDGKYNTVPDPLLVTIVRVHTPQGDELDAELEDAGLEGDLVSVVRDPYHEEICDEDEITIDPRNVPRPDSVRWVLPYHHYVAGTQKVRRVDGDFYGGIAGLCECIMHYEQGPSFSVWASFNLGLIFGLKSFYDRYCPPSGALLGIFPAELSGEYHLRFEGEADEDVYLTDDRLQELLLHREEARERAMSVIDIIAQVMQTHPAGAPFERIMTEVNIVRRTRRRMVASILSLYHCFHSRGKAHDLWTFDPRKAEQGRRKAKRKFIRPL